MKRIVLFFSLFLGLIFLLSVLASLDSLANRELYCEANRIFYEEKHIMEEIYGILIKNKDISKKSLFSKLKKKFPNSEGKYFFNNFNLFQQAYSYYMSNTIDCYTNKDKVALYRKVIVSNKFLKFFIKNKKKYVGITFNFCRKDFKKKPKFVAIK